MKWKIVLLGVVLCLIFSGCVPEGNGNTQTGGETGDQNTTSPTLAYEAMIAKLQQELIDLRAAQLEQNAAYEERIQELESMLSGSSGDQPTDNQPQENKNYTYIDTEGGILLTSYLGHETQVRIPTEIDGKSVVGIGEKAFRNSAVEQVIVPEGVKSIGWFAFYGSYRLSSVILPVSVTLIEYGAFELCSTSLRITCPPGSYAAQYAVSYGIPVISKTS